MATVYVSEQGAVLRKTGERLKVTLNRDVLLDIPLIKVSQVVILGKATVTAATVATLLEQEIEICYLTQRGRFIGRIVPAVSKNSLLRIEQYKAAFDEQRTLELARGFVVGKLSNLRTLLMRTAREQPFPEAEKSANAIKKAIDKAKKGRRIEQVRGYEGEGSAAYFSVFGNLLKQEGFNFTTRQRRPPTDPVNALLSFGYALLTNELFSAVNVVGFDPYIGYLHVERYGRPSLPLDLMEEFRPLIVDSIVLDCLNHRILTSNDFQQEMGDVHRLTEAGCTTFLTQYEKRKQTEFAHPVLKQTMTYQQSFEQQARFLAKTLQGEIPEYPPLLMK